MALRILIIVSVALLLAACRSPQKRVEERLGELRQQWQTNVAHQADLPERVVGWSEAVAQLLEHNLKLRQARLEVTNSQEAVRQIFRDLTPTLNLRAGLSKTLKDLGHTTFDEITFSADTFFNIPGLVNFGARLYSARLGLLRSQAYYALAEREQLIELYKLFLAAQDTQEHASHLVNQKATASAFLEVEPFTGQMMMSEVFLREIGQSQETETLQQRAGELLGSRAYQWVFQTNGLPDLRYDLAPLPLADTNRVAQLQMKLVAIELEAARAQLLGVKLRYWPELNLFVSGPPLYQRSFGTDRFWDADQVRATANVFWNLDTRGYISRQIRQLKRQQALQRERIRQETLALIDRLLHTQTLIEAAQEQLEQVNRQLVVLQEVPPVQTYSSLYKYAEDYRALVQRQRQLRRELAELNTLMWFVDESAWGQFPASEFLASAAESGAGEDPSGVQGNGSFPAHALERAGAAKMKNTN